MKKFFPILDWLPNYRWSVFKKDLPAGITVGVMLIPQGMAYAMIAGLPPVYGLYAALLPQFIYTILGTSRQLAVGPVAMDSLLVASGLGALSISGIQDYIGMAIFLALFMGVIQLLMGFLRLGFLVKFLSKPVISGFTSAAAIIIGLSQLKHLIGADIERSNKIQDLLVNAYSVLGQTNFVTLALGLSGITLIVLMKKKLKKIPSALVLVILGVLVTYGLELNIQGVAITGDVPTGLPSFRVPSVPLDRVMDLLPIAGTLALIAFMEGISVAKAVEERHDDYEVDPNQELIALGASNFFGSFLQSYPVTGGFSRTAVSDQAGAKTPMASAISAVVVLLTLLFLTPLFYYLPKALLASIIMVAVFGLIDFRYPIQLWKNHKDEFLLTIVTFIVTLTIGITTGIVVGAVLSMILFVYRVSKPHTTELGKVKGTDLHRNINRFEDEVNLPENVLLFRMDAQLFYGNQDYFKKKLLSKVNEKDDLKAVVLDVKSMSHVDSTGLTSLRQLIEDLRSRDVQLYLSEPNGPVRDLIYKTGLVGLIGQEHITNNCNEALIRIYGNQLSPELVRIANQTCVTNDTVHVHRAS